LGKGFVFLDELFVELAQFVGLIEDSGYLFLGGEWWEGDYHILYSAI
jgi:hypothetical protein